MYSRVGDGLERDRGTAATETLAEELEEILDDPHCRYLLEYLDGADEAVPESTLARHVVAGITDSPPEEVGDDVQRRVQTWLHHGQLPALDEYGLVEFDADAGEVRLRESDRR